MILIVTHKTDFTADFVINKLNRRKIDYKRLNCEDFLSSDFFFKYDPSFSYLLLGQNDYQAVWFRRTKLPEIKELSNYEKLYVWNEIECFFKNLFSILPVNWLSSPVSVYEAENKLLQLKAAQELGFDVPNTLLTNSKTELRDFYYDNGRDIVVKPISQTRVSNSDASTFIFTNLILPQHIAELEQFDLTPCIFQRKIPKKYELRVTVVGEQVFAAAIDSQKDEETKVDWRKKRLKFKEVELPMDLQNLCVQLLKTLNLGFGAIDLVKTPSGEYVFLEINPNGQWAWIENQTGQKISNAIIKYLTQ
jgi:glutathione synthase/RimK-type ligase-like ATP-grasp enzyme